MTQTVLLTGITGFIAKHVALDLLKQGYAVRGSLRSRSREDEVRSALRPHLDDESGLERLSFVELDLLEEDGWAAAMEGVDALMHTASPFPGGEPKDEMDLIRPAVEGTRRALRAAQVAGVKQVVLTSSCVAIYQKDLTDGQTLTEEDWSDPDHSSIGAYGKSKTLAEKAAWDFVAEHPEMTLTTINPGLVVGPPLDDKYGTSLQVIDQFLSGGLPGIPDVTFPIVDVRDVSRAHVAALSEPSVAGKRVMLAESFVPMARIAEVLREAYPDAKVPSRRIPTFVVRIGSLFSSQMRSMRPLLGKTIHAGNDRARALLGGSFEDRDASLLASAKAVSK